MTLHPPSPTKVFRERPASREDAKEYLIRSLQRPLVKTFAAFWVTPEGQVEFAGASLNAVEAGKVRDAMRLSPDFVEWLK